MGRSRWSTTVALGAAASLTLGMAPLSVDPPALTVPLPAEVPVGGLVDATGTLLGPGAFVSDNVEYLGTIPLDAPGVGGEVVDHEDGRTYFYATGLKGLSIYDVADPAAPVLVGSLLLPHSQNEDVKVSDDGTRTVISADGAFLLPVMPFSTGIHVVDTSDPTAPQLAASHPDSNHTAVCADPACDWIYGSTTGGIYDATRADEGVIERTERNWNVDAEGQTVGGRHALNRDEAGIVISDSNPRLVLDPRPHVHDGEEFGPHRPRLLAQGLRDDDLDPRLQHNNVRPNATEWEPRRRHRGGAKAGQPLPPDAYDEPDGAGVLAPGSLRDGELLIANSESNLNPTCDMAGGISTWDMRDFDAGRSPVQLEIFRPANGTFVDGDPAVNALGCSGHWFTVQDDLITASWYEHGVRFIEVGLDTGSLEEVGFFQPVATQAGAAYWIDDEHVYSVDYARGIDILRFDRDAPRPSDDERGASWAQNLGVQRGLAATDRFTCALATAD